MGPLILPCSSQPEALTFCLEARESLMTAQGNEVNWCRMSSWPCPHGPWLCPPHGYWKKLTLSWPEPGHYPPLILHYLCHAQILQLPTIYIYTNVYKYIHTLLYAHLYTKIYLIYLIIYLSIYSSIYLPTYQQRYNFHSPQPSLQGICWNHLVHDCGFYPS